MVDFNDRRSNRDALYEVTTPGDEEWDRWSRIPHTEGRKEVASYYRGQQSTPEWAEANRLAKRRADHQFRRAAATEFPSAASYADSYHDHLSRVIAIKGKSIQDRLYGDHPTYGYGRS